MTAPLTAEVAQMVTRLRGQDAIPNRNEVADMLTTLATQLAERDAELARVTLSRDDWMGDAKAAWAKYKDAIARIAALTEALRYHNGFDNNDGWTAITTDKETTA